MGVWGRNRRDSDKRRQKRVVEREQDERKEGSKEGEEGGRTDLPERLTHEPNSPFSHFLGEDSARGRANGKLRNRTPDSSGESTGRDPGHTVTMWCRCVTFRDPLGHQCLVGSWRQQKSVEHKDILAGVRSRPCSSPPRVSHGSGTLLRTQVSTWGP